MNAHGGLYITGNTTPSRAPFAAAKHTQGWVASSVGSRGDQSVVPSAANSQLTLVPGIYLVLASLTIESEDISGTSGDDIGAVSMLLYLAGAAVLGAKNTTHQLDSDRPQTVTISKPVEVTQAMQDAGTNYVELYLKSGDASGNDITVSEGHLDAVRIG